MRKFKAITIFLFFALPLTAFCQMSLNVRAGVAINNFNFSGNNDDLTNQFRQGYANHTGFLVGMGGQLVISDRFSFKPEIQFINRGGTYSGDISSERIKYNLNYLDLPLLLSFGWKRLTIDFGPGFGFLLSSKAKSDSGTSDANYLFEDSFDFGLNAGLTYEVSKRFAVIGRYYYGLAEVAKIAYADQGNNKSEIIFRNRTIQLALAYKIK